MATRYHIPSVGVTWALRFRAGKNTYRTETKKAITVLYVHAYWLQRLKYVINPSFFPVVSYSEALYNLRFTQNCPLSEARPPRSPPVAMSSTAARRVAQLNAHLTDAPVDQIQRFPTAAVRSRPDPTRAPMRHNNAPTQKPAPPSVSIAASACPHTH